MDIPNTITLMGFSIGTIALGAFGAAYCFYKGKYIVKKKKKDLAVGLAVLGLLMSGIIAVGPAAVSNAGNQVQQIQGAVTSAIVTMASVDAASPGTAVTATYKYNTNADATYKTLSSGSTTIDQGKSGTILATNGTTYHNAIMAYSVGATDKTLTPTVPLAHNATVTMTVTDPSAFKSLTSGGGANNYTIGAGGTMNVNVNFQGTGYQSTQDMTCVLEVSNKVEMDITKTQVTGITGGFLSSTPVLGAPTCYTIAGTGSATMVFGLSPLTDSSIKSLSVSVPSVGSTDMSGHYAKMTCYTKEHFVDDGTGSTNGQLIYDIQNSAGTKKSLATYSFTWYTI